MKKGVLTGLVFSVVAFVLSLITIIVSFHSMANTSSNFEASFSIINNSGLINSSINIVALILGCSLFIGSIVMLSFTLKLIASKKNSII